VAIYAIGDVQGCFDELQRLLERLNFDTANDEVWFVGDLVNRGPHSAKVLRLVRSLGKSAVVTLGNHDLHLIALGRGHRMSGNDKDLAAVLREPGSDELIDWLRGQSLAHYRPDLNTLMVHAGLPPQWDPLLTVKLAREVEAVIGGDQVDTFLPEMYGDRPNHWDATLTGNDRLRFITNSLTRLRYCDRSGLLDLAPKGPPGTQAKRLWPWFELPDRAAAAVRIVFGHWSAAGLVQRKNLLGIDTGCVWGGTLTAVRLDGPTRIYQITSSQPKRF
jgi:bis(5'-nucleosyl)-tetraphosphatase (symmetrical)